MSNMEMHNRVAHHLKNMHINISSGNEWFKQCVDFFRTNNPNVINQRIFKLKCQVKTSVNIFIFSVMQTIYPLWWRNN